MALSIEVGNVVVAVGGDSAITEGIFLTKYAQTVLIIIRRDAFRATKIYLDDAFSNPKIKVILNTVIESIYGKEKVDGVVTQNMVTKEKTDIRCDGVFVFIGSSPNTSFLGNLLCPLMQAAILRQTYIWKRRLKGLYAVGDIRKNSYRQIATAIGEESRQPLQRTQIG